MMLQQIKQAAMDAVAASNPVNVLLGNVKSTNPLMINVDQRFDLDADFLIHTESMTELRVTVGGTEYTVRPGLQVGDKVVLLRVQGGQQYVILDRVVST